MLIKHIFSRTICALGLGLFAFQSLAQKPLKIVTTTPDLKVIVEAVGKDRVQVFSIASGVQDVHTIEAKPSFMIRLQGADQVFAQGLDLETAWLEPLIFGARNTKLKVGTKSVLELGESLQPIEVHLGEVSRAQGDVHPKGNPHFQLDPIRMGQAADLIANRLSELDPSSADFYKDNAAKMRLDLEQKTKDWQRRIKATGVKEIITYHKTFAYFCDRFGIKCDMQLEPKPGIPPTTSHLVGVLKAAKERDIKLILIENYFDIESGRKLKSQNPNFVLAVSPVAVEGEPQINSTASLVERVVNIFEESINAKP